MATAAMLVASAVSTLGYCGILHDLQTALHGHSNDVAVKVAELKLEPPRWGDGEVRGLSFSPDGAHLATDSNFATINVWNWRSGRVQRTLDAPKGSGSGGNFFDPIQYSPDGRMLVLLATNYPGSVALRVWNTRDWSIKQDIVHPALPGMYESMAFTPDGRFLICAEFGVIHSSELIAYSTGTWRVAWTVTLGVWHHYDVEPHGMAISPNGRLLAVSGTDSIVVKRPPPGTPPRYLGWMNHHEQVVVIVNLTSRKIVKTLHADASGSVAWSPDGSRIAVAGDGHIDIFSARSGMRMVSESIPQSGQMYVRFTPNGRYLITSDFHGPLGTPSPGVRIYDSTAKKQLQRISVDSPSVAVSRDGKFLAIGGANRTTIWRIK